jgi:hypothetical protein
MDIFSSLTHSTLESLGKVILDFAALSVAQILPASLRTS